MSGNKLFAWIAPQGDDKFVAAFRAAAAPNRAPATQACSSADEARRWVEHEAAALDVPVAWVGEAPVDKGGSTG
jgi:hypothetical protein